MEVGIEITKKSMSIIFEITQNIISQIKTNKKVGWFRLMTLVVGKLFPIADVVNDRQKLLDEIKNLSEAEKAELVTWAETQLQMPNEKAKKTVEKSIQLLFSIVDFGFEMSDIWGK